MYIIYESFRSVQYREISNFFPELGCVQILHQNSLKLNFEKMARPQKKKELYCRLKTQNGLTNDVSELTRLHFLRCGYQSRGVDHRVQAQKYGVYGYVAVSSVSPW